jgi:hypothetical protein
LDVWDNCSDDIIYIVVKGSAYLNVLRSQAIVAEGCYNPVDSALLEADPGLRRMSSIFWMFATHAAEVEVDIETGEVTVIKVAAAHDVGRAINPTACEQQIEGAVIMGISNTLMEEYGQSSGIPGIAVNINNKEVGKTDAQGVFVYESKTLPKSAADVTVTKSGFATWRKTGKLEPGGNRYPNRRHQPERKAGRELCHLLCRCAFCGSLQGR